MIPQKLERFKDNFGGYGDAITLLQIATHGMFCLNPGSDIARGIDYVIQDYGFEGKIFWGLDRVETFDFEEVKLTHAEYLQMADWALEMLKASKPE